MCFLCVCVPVFFCLSFAVCSRYCATSVQPTCSGSIILSARRHLHTIRLIFFIFYFSTRHWVGGLVYIPHKVFFGGGVAIWWYSRKKKQNFAIFICFLYWGVVSYLRNSLTVFGGGTFFFCKRQSGEKMSNIFEFISFAVGQDVFASSDLFETRN